jgi:ferritin-like metal-binding protein YciE
MQGLVEEGGAVIKEKDMNGGIKDAALIAAAQRVEHYEIAGYGCLSAYATRLGEHDAATVLSQTLQEEKEADEALNDIAEELNIEVPQESAPSGKRPGKSSRGRTRSAA